MTTAAAIAQPWEPGRPLAWYPPALVRLIGGRVVIDKRLHAFTRLPRHGGGGTVVHDPLPLGEGALTLLRAPTARWHLALRCALGQGARIRRMAHNRPHRRHGGRAPHRGAGARATGPAETLGAQQAPHWPGRAPREAGLADQAQRMLHGPVGIVDHAAVVWAQHTGRSGQGHGAALGLLRHARQQTAPQGVELALAPAPLPAHQETTMGRRGIVDPIAVRQQPLLSGTQSEPGLPSGAVP